MLALARLKEFDEALKFTDQLIDNATKTAAGIS